VVSKLTDWDDEDPSKGSATAARWEKVMILKHMFTQKELEEDPAAILDIKEDIREECSKVGNVTNVVLYDQEPDGVVSVRFSEPEQAKACVQMMNGRFFAGTRVEAYIADGTEKFRRTNEKRAAIMAGLDGDDVGWEGGAEADEARRLDKFGSWLESEAKEGKKETEQGKEKAES
jgi:HIV Tat-specific factor 1